MADARPGYHHGDLHAALVLAGLELSRGAGAEAVVLREATRMAGVTARAAYRHFDDRAALVRAVARAALAEMARTIDRRQRGAAGGRGLLAAVGEGYVRFALAEPGWFDVALFAMADMANTADPATVGDGGRSPYQQLIHALQVLVAEGSLAPAAVQDAAVLCWSGVHGFATLATHGPLRELPRRRAFSVGDRLVAGLVAAVVADPADAGRNADQPGSRP